MTKKLLNWTLMAALTVGLGFAVTSCKDDDDKNTSEQRNEDANPLDTDEAQTAWRWLCALTDAETLPDDWAKKTFEPTVGVVSENNANTRIIVVGDLDEAKAKFADLADVEVSKLGSDYTASQSGVGKLEWTPSKQGAQNLAEVTVDTKLIPKLQKLVYCTEEQVGVNGWFGDNVDGTAWYRLGDVVEDGQGYYWVCVRPSFKQGDKGDSHWMNIYNASETGQGRDGIKKPMLDENIYSKYDNVAKYNNKTILLPTQLKYSREHMNNFTNLIWALLDPDAYATKVGTSEDLKENGLCGFDYKYHGKLFLNNVAAQWDKNTSTGYNIWQILFNRTRTDMKGKLAEMILLYQGYRWRVGRTGYVWEYKSQATQGFQKVAPGSESGDMVLYEFADKGYDIRRYAGDPVAANSNAEMIPQFNNYITRYVVRYKTGKQLSSTGNYSPYEKISGCTDIYRYNEVYGVELHSNPQTEKDIETNASQEILATPVVGCIVGEDGIFYKDLAAAKKHKKTAVAVVVYAGPKYVENNRQYPDMPHYNGLALSIRQSTNMQFSSSLAPDGICFYQCTDYDDFFIVRNGLKAIECFDAANCKTGRHIGGHYNTNTWAADEVLQRNATNFSRWFLPSVGQWILVLKEFGYTWKGQTESFGNAVVGYENLRKTMTAAGINFMPRRYFTATEANDKEYYTIRVESDNAQFVKNNKKGDVVGAFAFTAFTFGNGATDDDLMDR